MQPLEWNDLDDLAVNTARVLAADAVEKAGNGHPGTAISLAPVAYLLYQKVMRHDPQNKNWLGRDRFILSIGHSSLTQYVQLYLGGFGLELDDIKALRQWGSKTPGHPEYGHTDGVEITTGPLGQGLASATGFAYAARYERGLFDPETAAGESVFDHYVYVLAGDGDIQEGVTAEAASLAGHQKLGNLIAIYDSNQISIEDDTDIAFSEDVAARYRSYGWQVLEVNWRKDAAYREDVAELYAAIEQAQQETDRPTLIILHTIIGWPSPNKQNTGGIHGSALGGAELEALKTELGFNTAATFAVADEVITHTRKLRERATAEVANWKNSFNAWKTQNPERYALLQRLENHKLPADIAQALPEFSSEKAIATRAASGKVLAALGPVLPELWGGSADLAGSNNTTIPDSLSFVPAEHSTKAWQGGPYGRVLHFGIREHAMGAILNGIQLHGKTRAYGGTFLQFADYMRPAVRLAALMNIPSVFVWTHDSIGLGEDGPTHQPVEHLAALRAIPNLAVVRPADANEVAIAWHEILSRHAGPTGIILSRQNLPVFERGNALADREQTRRGAYVLAPANKTVADVILIATGSEVEIALAAREQLAAEGIAASVVSAPCLEWFNEQDTIYRDSVLDPRVIARVVVEAGISMGWERYAGAAGEYVCVENFGASADYKRLYQEYGLIPEAVTAAAKRSINKAL
ncbi:transketolase [Canibacter sp. lx-45]|uniref:transketolase n=1 Tax=Canibacter zhuwentaonis TaxID=2837491 RepID=UPI001BDD613C|nr:transketolase [Canibacter zhuwentaonis]MBT1035656.1 transketolase [Canibacter zhuwentaonis]